jgi:hypothetical protein
MTETVENVITMVINNPGKHTLNDLLVDSQTLVGAMGMGSHSIGEMQPIIDQAVDSGEIFEEGGFYFPKGYKV